MSTLNLFTQHISYFGHVCLYYIPFCVSAGSGAQEARVQRKDDRGWHIRGWEALHEGPAGGGRAGLHSLHRSASSEGTSVWTPSGQSTGPSQYEHSLFYTLKMTEKSQWGTVEKLWNSRPHHSCVFVDFISRVVLRCLETPWVQTQSDSLNVL